MTEPKVTGEGTAPRTIAKKGKFPIESSYPFSALMMMRYLAGERATPPRRCARRIELAARIRGLAIAIVVREIDKWLAALAADEKARQQ